MAADDRRGGIEALVAATRETHRTEADPTTIGVTAEVLRGRRAVLGDIVAAGGAFTAYPAVVETPYLIWARPIGILYDSQTVPGDNRARVKGSHDGSGDPYSGATDTVSFHYFWDNPSAGYALVDVSSTLVTKGRIVATGNTGIVSGGTASLSASADLILYSWAGEPALTPQAGQREDMYGVQATGGGVWSGETGKLVQRGVFYEATLEYRRFPIPPGARAYFEVRLTLTTLFAYGSGSTSFDFESAGEDNYVQCPSLTVTVLSGPAVATA